VALISTDVDVCESHRAKIRYATRREAWDVAKQMNSFGGRGQKQAYQCKGCGAFFVGTALPPHVKVRLRRLARMRAASS
jgi:hypothetical protein